MYRLRLLLILTAFFPVALSAQDIPVFSWQSHFSYHAIHHVQNGSDGIYGGTNRALYFVDSEDNSLRFLNKITGLSDTGIGAIHHNDNHFVIGYQNGNLDILAGETLRNITTILDAENLEQKAFTSLTIKNAELWGGTAFGMIRYNLNRNEFTETYQNIGQNASRLGINDFVITQDSILAASDDGMLSVSLDDNTNRQDFNFWQRQLTGISFSKIVQNELGFFAASDSDLFKQENGLWQFADNFSTEIQALLPTQSAILVLTSNALYQLSEAGLEEIISTKKSWGNFQSIALRNDEFLIGTALSGLLRFQNATADPEIILPEGPVSDLHSATIDSAGKQFWTSFGKISSFAPENSVWSAIETKINNGQVLDMIVDIDVNGPSQTITSLTGGPYLKSGNGFSSVHLALSASSPLIESNGILNIPAVAYQNSKLWVVQRGADPALSAWQAESDVWEIYNLSHPLRNYINNIYTVDNGDKWMPIDVDRGGGVLVFNAEDNRLRYLNTNGGQGGLTGKEITHIAQDQDGFIWITTNEGICFFPNPNQILTNAALTANVPIFEGRLLLRNEYLTSVLIDPANRKWIATRDNGVWLFNETGETLIQHFTTENSPLSSNEVRAMGMDPKSGKVFFTTSEGIISFRADATEGTGQHQNVKIYPNPVKPGFTGNVVIEGLVNNAYLKLTDVSGKLVREIRANGSTAIWNTRDLNGSRVTAGVYLLFSSNRDGSETFIGKIVVI